MEQSQYNQVPSVYSYYVDGNFVHKNFAVTHFTSLAGTIRLLSKQAKGCPLDTDRKQAF
jgi:hypothetical protein